MTEFQKEIGVVIVLLGFFLGYFACVETVRIEVAGRSGTVKNGKKVVNENSESGCFASHLDCGW